MQGQADTKRRKIIKVLIIVIVVLVLILGIGLIVRAVTGGGKTDDADAVITPQVAADPRERYDNLTDFVQRFYDEYFASPEDGTSASDQRALALNGFGDENAMQNFLAHEKQCIQNPPSSATVISVSGLDDPYRADVSYDYTDGPSQGMIVTVHDAGGYFVIHDVSCAQA